MQQFKREITEKMQVFRPMTVLGSFSLICVSLDFLRFAYFAFFFFL